LVLSTYRQSEVPPVSFYLLKSKKFLQKISKKWYIRRNGDTPDMTTLVPLIEENIPLPENAKDAFPDLSAEQELQMRANVIKLMSDLTGQELSPTKENAEEAKSIAREMINNPQYRPDYSKYPNETLAMLAGMVAQMNVSIVEELSDLKMYVVNKLVAEIEAAKDPKVRVAALGKLGEVDGVDAFKKRTEVTHKILSIQEVEAELLETLGNLETKVIDVEAREIVKNEQPDA